MINPAPQTSYVGDETHWSNGSVLFNLTCVSPSSLIHQFLHLYSGTSNVQLNILLVQFQRTKAHCTQMDLFPVIYWKPSSLSLIPVVPVQARGVRRCGKLVVILLSKKVKGKKGQRPKKQKQHSDMLQNDTFCIFFLSFHSTSCFFFKHWMQRKRSTEEEESATAVQREIKEQNWRNETGFIQVSFFFNCCVHPCIPPTECYCDLVSCSEKSMTGERSPLSVRLSSHSLHLVVLPVCLHRFFGGGAVRGGVTGRVGIPPYWYFAFFSEGFRIYNKQNKNRYQVSKGEKIPLKTKENTRALSINTKYYLRNKDRW